MKKFLLGLAVGALGTYAAIKLSDEETREELGEKFDEYKEKAKEGIEQGKTYGKMRSLRAGVVARKEYRKSVKGINQRAANVASKLIDVLEDLETKAQANANSIK
ncbi:MAG: YtxH domain-containing protein [Dysgonamonadaceae bacterium]